MLDIIRHQGNANQNHKEKLFHIYLHNCNKKKNYRVSQDMKEMVPSFAAGGTVNGTTV